MDVKKWMKIKIFQDWLDFWNGNTNMEGRKENKVFPSNRKSNGKENGKNQWKRRIEKAY